MIKRKCCAWNYSLFDTLCSLFKDRKKYVYCTVHKVLYPSRFRTRNMGKIWRRKKLNWQFILSTFTCALSQFNIHLRTVTIILIYVYLNVIQLDCMLVHCSMLMRIKQLGWNIRGSSHRVPEGAAGVTVEYCKISPKVERAPTKTY